MLLGGQRGNTCMAGMRSQQGTYPGSRRGPRTTQYVFVRVCKGEAPGHALKAYKRVAVGSHAFVTSAAYCGEIQIHALDTYHLRKIAVTIK